MKAIRILIILAIFLFSCNNNKKSFQTNSDNCTHDCDFDEESSNTYTEGQINHNKLNFLIDEYSDNRDIIIDSIDCNGKTIWLKRVLVPLGNDEQKYSIRNGRELMISISDEVVTKYFNEIDGYSSLFLENANIHKVRFDNDKLTTIIIEIDAHESLNHLWVYQVMGCDFKYISNLRADSLVIKDNYFLVKNFLLIENWEELVDIDMLFSILFREQYNLYEGLYSLKAYSILDNLMVPAKVDDTDKDEYIKYLIELKERLETAKNDTTVFVSNFTIDHVLNKIDSLITD